MVKIRILFKPFIVIILIFILTLIPVESVVYRPGVKPGTELEYDLLHYSDIKNMTVKVTSIEGNLIELTTLAAYYDGTVTRKNITINLGISEKMTIVPTDEIEGWISINGNNIINSTNSQLELSLTPFNGYAEVDYIFKTPLDLSALNHFYYYVSISNSTDVEKYMIMMTDNSNKSKIFQIQQNTDNKINPAYNIWDKKEWFNFDTITNEELDRSQIKRISIIYAGNNTRIVKLKNFETDQPMNLGSGLFKYSFISLGLVKGDPIYPGLPYVINEELPDDNNPDPIILQHSYRNLVVSYTDCESGSCSSAYTYDKDSGILVKYWTSKSGVQIQLKDQKNAWNTPNSIVFLIILIHEAWINYVVPNSWYVLSLVSIYITSFIAIAAYDRWKRGTLTLGMMKQWWPFLIILLIIFVIGEIVRRIGA
ncbi:MAG TPA: hypothetical protein VIH27_01140 [Nitrososphaerales archaeon]